MMLNRQELVDALDVAKLAVDTRDFIPILSHFCFNRKHVTAYNDFIGIKVAFPSKLNLALQAQTLMRLLNSVTEEEIYIGEAKKTVFFRVGPKSRPKVRARLPYLGSEDFFFRFPSMRSLTGVELTEAQAEKFFKGLRLCLNSVGDQMPNQMGITLHEKKRLYMYSTNNKAISKYHMVPIGNEGTTSPIILPTLFCQALLKGESVYGTEGCKFTVGKDFAVMQFGDECSMYGKLVNNKDPLDFEKVISQHTKGWKDGKQKVPEGFHELFDRALLMLGNELHKVVEVKAERQTVTVEGQSSLGGVKSSADFGRELGYKEVIIDAELVKKAADTCSEFFMGDGALVFSQPNYMHLVSTHTN